eukprot:CAMPEP_0195078492 /NCGR_PEP_ID=MMETSP0448-20130528/20673_1 /TAXON_ID=66468 /ORGANISM="Heterocapsa triquestra, Strain CCMP 448" /LENGTH=91 /DNA_ID=CAMNT_0040111237 /DNA_START=73 /DNA_END=348 /DNA_ORIENTATION=+
MLVSALARSFLPAPSSWRLATAPRPSQWHEGGCSTSGVAACVSAAGGAGDDAPSACASLAANGTVRAIRRRDATQGAKSGSTRGLCPDAHE